VLALLEASDDELLTRFGRWYIPRREPRYLRRNALIVLGNAAAVPVAEPVAAALARWTRDADPIVRGAAIWAARRLRLDALVPNAAEEPDEVIRAELAGEVPVRAGSSGPERPPSRGADRR
jgi:epoxyqueuosine reductase